jgi:hypothetical protein
MYNADSNKEREIMNKLFNEEFSFLSFENEEEEKRHVNVASNEWRSPLKINSKRFAVFRNSLTD